MIPAVLIEHGDYKCVVEDVTRVQLLRYNARVLKLSLSSAWIFWIWDELNVAHRIHIASILEYKDQSDPREVHEQVAAEVTSHAGDLVLVPQPAIPMKYEEIRWLVERTN